MLLNIVFVHCISIVLANFYITDETVDTDPLTADTDPLTADTDPLTEYMSSVIRKPRFVLKKGDYDMISPSCDQMPRTSLSPFVVLLLFRNSGNFLGMGSIIDKGRILTARKVVENSVYSPNSLIALAGRLGPWWGRGSQAKVLEEIYQSDGDLALAKIKGSFSFNPNISPIKLRIPRLGNINNGSYAIFGIPRSSVDVPGDPAPKTSMYFVTIETPLSDVEACTSEFSNVDYNDTYNFCTGSNATYGWGCIGSPTVAMDKSGKVIQVAVVTSTAITERDFCHIHTKIAPHHQWIRSHSLINYKVPDYEP